MDLVFQEIGINSQHLCESSVPGRYQLICDKAWLQTLERRKKISSFPIHGKLDRRAHPPDPLEHPWTKIVVQTYRKHPTLKVFPLQRSLKNLYNEETTNEFEMPMSYSQAVSYVANTNFKNLWETAFKQYGGGNLKVCKPSSGVNKLMQTPPGTALLPYDIVLKELIMKIFRCPILHCKLDRYKGNEKVHEADKDKDTANTTESHANILPALAAIETSTHFVVLFYPPAIATSLYDCITYSPAVLNKSYNKPLFIIYQLFQLSKSLQDIGLCMGDISLHDILIKDNLWIQVIPRLKANILQPNDEEAPVGNSNSEIGEGHVLNSPMPFDNENDDDEGQYSLNAKFDLKFAYDLDQFTLREYCEMWCNGQLSNYDYLTILNNASGRKINNPAYHHIMPWVTDFTSRNGNNWRDLTKSKYRLNKGDTQLDLMFTHATQQGHNDLLSDIDHGIVRQVPHHVSDFLSEITYFVYMARRTPQNILCEHVRPIWVPAEYPVSIQRLQEWTPDECIPEFYTDPMIFKSIHEDLPDLELPTWASCPEDFICKHREALESQYVSERLHHWIDLNFGYKLTGKAAIKSKNVCLSMVDQHKFLCQRGVVQLFIQPHPPKKFTSIWYQRTAPRLSQLYQNNKNMNQKLSTDTKRLAKSSENINLNASNNELNMAGNSPRMSLRQSIIPNDEYASTSNFYPSTNIIELPKDYNPVAMLQNLETQQTFFMKTFPKQKASLNTQEKMINSDLLFDDNSEEHSFTNHLFVDGNAYGETGTQKKSKGCLLAPGLNSANKKTIKHLLKEQFGRENQIMGCLIVEIFAMQRLRPLLLSGGNARFEDRLEASKTVARLYKQDIPKCFRYIVGLLLKLQPPEVVSSKGLPPPSAAQILEPIFSNLLCPFPINYYAIYMLIRSLKNFEFDNTLLELYTHFDCNGKECYKYTDIDRKRVLHARKIAECKVLSCCAHIRHLLEPQAYEQFSMVELLLPHIIDLLNDEKTSILTAWNLFDPVAQALGIANTQKYLLLPIMKLYDVECFDRGMMSVRNRMTDSNEASTSHLRFSTSSSFKSRKSVKLYHQIFLLSLIVRFGLRCFLQNFIAPLIEAVGGYKEPEDGNGFHYHNNSNSVNNSRRTSKHLSDVIDNSSLNLLSEQVSELETEDLTLPAKGEMEEVFTFEDDINSDHISNPGTSENKSLDSFDMKATPAEEAKEDTNIETNPEKLAISELIYGSKLSNLSFEEPEKLSPNTQSTTNEFLNTNPKSPTIEIPFNALRRSYQLNAIDCDIGSRKSVDSFEIITQAAMEEQKQKREASEQNSSEVGDNVDGCDSLQASVISKMSEAKAAQNNRISEMSAESLVWLSGRLGPVLTSRFITRNLLKMLTLCYVGQENQLPETNTKAETGNLNYFSVADARVVGDRSASRVIECLISIAALYGEEVILLQYFPHISELVALSTKRLTGSLEGAIISTLQLLKCIIPCLMDTTIMEHLKDTILNCIFLPILRLVASTRLLMPSGYLGRSVLARKFLDAVYVLCVRIGPDMSKEHICLPVLRPFYLIFDKCFNIHDHDTLAISPPKVSESNQREMEELRDVFSPALAHTAYLAFLKFLGESIMNRTILNMEFILTLCHEFEQPDYKLTKSLNAQAEEGANDSLEFPRTQKRSIDHDIEVANSFGTHIVGNRLDVMNNSITAPTKQEIGSMEVLDMVAYKFEQFTATRHLKGNWLAYWRHEISRPDKDFSLNIKQIKLQTFAGHTNSVRAIYALDNENSFISASKDKTVKLWSLRSEGDGQKVTNSQFTYCAHKKSINSLAYLDAMRYVVSCDSGVHIWDPFIGRPLGILDSSKHNPITIVKCLPSPSPLVLAGTAESSVKIIDTRTMQYVNEWRVTPMSQNSSTIRCLTVAPSGNWLAVGLSTGSIVMLDARTGTVIQSWRPMESELLQLTAANEKQLVSSALEHSLAVWQAHEGNLQYQLRPPSEPAHFLQTIGSELVYATTGNQIGIYSDINSSHAPSSITKLRSETFRGVLTSLAVLPLNRAFLAGNESGNIVLLC